MTFDLDILHAVADFNLPLPHLVPPLLITPTNFAEIFGVRDLESLGYRTALFAWFYV